MNWFATVHVGTVLASLTMSLLIAGRNSNDPKSATKQLNRGKP